MSKILEGFDSLGQVAVELSHAGGEERVDHGAREEAPQVCLEETENVGFVGLSGNGVEEKHKRNFNTKTRSKGSTVKMASTVFFSVCLCVSILTLRWGHRCNHMDG